MQDSLFFHFQYDLERQLEDLIDICLNVTLPALHLIGTREIRLDFTDRNNLNHAIDAFRSHTSFLQDLEIDRIEFQYQGEFYIKYSVPALSETGQDRQAEFDKTRDSLKALAAGRRGGKRLLDSSLWKKLA
ncbi:MAG: hypothetical protein AB4290_01295 [Spirulina sp.]